jgi:ubiquitin-like 1-activating enzyme E1 B
MPDMWKSRKPPVPLSYDDVLGRASDALADKESLLRDGQRIWSLEESLVVFQDSLQRLSQRMKKMKEEKAEADESPVIEFDKDDQDTLDFVASSSNIRSLVFGIDRKSRFDIKQMAGNIIPAIATTNAIVAGLCVLQAFKIIRGEFDEAKEVRDKRHLVHLLTRNSLTDSSTRSSLPPLHQLGSLRATDLVRPTPTARCAARTRPAHISTCRERP